MDARDFEDGSYEELVPVEELCILKTNRPVPQVIRFDNQSPTSPGRDAMMLNTILSSTLPPDTLRALKELWIQDIRFLETELTYLKELNSLLMRNKYEKAFLQEFFPKGEAPSKTDSKPKERSAKKSGTRPKTVKDLAKSRQEEIPEDDGA